MFFESNNLFDVNSIILKERVNTNKLFYWKAFSLYPPVFNCGMAFIL